MNIDIEKIEKSPCPQPINDFKGFKTSHPIVGENAEDRNNAGLYAWKYANIANYVIPTIVDGKQIPIEQAMNMNEENGFNDLPKFQTIDEAITWAYHKKNKINPDGTVED